MLNDRCFALKSGSDARCRNFASNDFSRRQERGLVDTTGRQPGGAAGLGPPGGLPSCRQDSSGNGLRSRYCRGRVWDTGQHLVGEVKGSRVPSTQQDIEEAPRQLEA